MYTFVMGTYSITYQTRHETLAQVIGAIKLVSFIGSALLAALLISNAVSFNITSFLPKKDPLVLVTTPLSYTFFPDVGKVATPHIDIPVVSDDDATTTLTFLIDSGAKISALPQKYAAELGIDTATAKRIYLRSATNNTVYGYLTEVTLRLGPKDVPVPIVFADVIEPLLGTYGFFDHFTIVFDSSHEEIIIKEKS